MGKILVLFNNLAPLLLISILLAFAGFVIFGLIYKTNNKLLTLGSSMILGPLGFLLVLSTGSYIFKGQIAIQLMFLAYLAVVLWFLHSFKHRVFESINYKFRLNHLVVLVFLLFYLGAIFLFAHRSFIGSDSDMYFAIATSFAKGNYPVVQSWQSTFLTVYHQGTYLLEGAFRSLSGKDIELIHYFFSLYLVWAVFLFLTGLVREKTRSFLCLLPPLFGLILIGGPVLLVGFSELGRLFTSLSSQPDFAFFQSSNGAGVTNLSSMVYTNFYTFGLAIFLVFGLLLIGILNKGFSMFKYLVLLVIIMLGLSVDETFFPVEAFLFVSLAAWQLRKLPLFRKIVNISILGISFMGLFLVIQNPIRDSFFTKSPEGPRFKMLLENSFPVFGDLFYLPGEKINWNGFSTGLTPSEIVRSRVNYSDLKSLGNWVRPGLGTVVAFLLIGLILAPSRWVLLLLASSVISYVLSLILINTFWPPNALRVSNQAFQLAFIALGFVIINLLTQKSWFKKALGIIIILLLSPQIITSQLKTFTFPLVKWEANVADARNNFTQVKKEPELQEVTKYIPAGKVALFLDRYPDIAPFSYLNYTALTKFGVFVPISPVGVKILNPAPGIEWLDAVNSLSPYALADLKTDYVYIQDAARNRLSPDKLKKLDDSQYFEKVKIFDQGVLYRVLAAFKTEPDEPNSLRQMSRAIGTGNKVYLDKLQFNEVRKALILELAKKNSLIGQPPAHGGDFYMYIETLLPFEAENSGNIKSLDFVITDKNKDPNNILPGKFKKLLLNNFISLWIKAPK